MSLSNVIKIEAANVGINVSNVASEWQALIDETRGIMFTVDYNDKTDEIFVADEKGQTVVGIVEEVVETLDYLVSFDERTEQNLQDLRESDMLAEALAF